MLEKGKGSYRGTRHGDTSTLWCKKCGLQLDITRNCAYLGGVLTMPCVGAIGDSVVKHASQYDAGPDDILIFNNIQAHASHTMATSGGLKLHFCLACGACGAFRSKHLKLPFTHKASKAGREALRAIAQGKRPNEAQRGPMLLYY